ncbi:MAG: hypothetical protein GY869_03125, partial [Planctomycetes bacterium]|nr:hypothetical protein [Planctomycetota bacterium]
GVSLSADGQRVAVALDEYTAVVIDLSTQNILAQFAGHQGRIRSIQFSPDGSKVLSTSDDQTARIWNSTTGNEILVLSDHTGPVRTGTYSPDGKQIVTVSDDKKAILWDSRTGTPLHVFASHTDPVLHAVFSQDGAKLITSSADNTAIIWNVQSRQLVYKLAGHSNAVYSGSFSPDGHRVVTSSMDHTCRLWDVETGQELIILRGHTSEVTSAVFDPEGSYILSTSDDGYLRKWQAVPRRLADLSGTKDQSGSERLALFRQQAMPDDLPVIVQNRPVTLVVISDLNTFGDSMVRWRDSLQAAISEGQPFPGKLTLDVSQRNALVRLGFFENDRILSINGIQIVNYDQALQAVNQLLQIITQPDLPEITIELQRQEHDLTIKFRFISPLDLIEQDISLPRAELIDILQRKRAELDNRPKLFLESNQEYAQDLGDPITEPNGLNGFWVFSSLVDYTQQRDYLLGLAMGDRIVQVNDQLLTNINDLKSIYDNLIQSAQSEDEFNLSLMVERGQWQRLKITIRTR